MREKPQIYSISLGRVFLLYFSLTVVLVAGLYPIGAVGKASNAPDWVLSLFGFIIGILLLVAYYGKRFYLYPG